jgi:hypothetical protein
VSDAPCIIPGGISCPSLNFGDEHEPFEKVIRTDRVYLFVPPLILNEVSVGCGMEIPIGKFFPFINHISRTMCGAVDDSPYD